MLESSILRLNLSVAVMFTYVVQAHTPAQLNGGPRSFIVSLGSFSALVYCSLPPSLYEMESVIYCPHLLLRQASAALDAQTAAIFSFRPLNLADFLPLSDFELFHINLINAFGADSSIASGRHYLRSARDLSNWNDWHSHLQR